MIRKWLQPLGQERKQEVLDELSQASSPGFDYFLLVTLSCSIATFGLITNSVAVIIGAMLVAPLMSPILGLSLASVAGEQGMFRKAAVALVEGSLAAVALSTLLGLIASVLPLGIFNVLPSEILARTHPSPFDLGIGLAGGAAAAYALAQPRLSAALPGVAIATAFNATALYGRHWHFTWQRQCGFWCIFTFPDQPGSDLFCRDRGVRRPGFSPPADRRYLAFHPEEFISFSGPDSDHYRASYHADTAISWPGTT